MQKIDELIDELASCAQELGSDMPALGADKDLANARAAIRAAFAALSDELGVANVTIIERNLAHMAALAEVEKLKARVAELEAERHAIPLAEIPEGGLHMIVTYYTELAVAIDNQSLTVTTHGERLAWIKAIRARVAELEKAQAWIPVGERLPEDEAGLYFVYDGSERNIACFSKRAYGKNGDSVEANTFYMTDQNGYDYSIRPLFWTHAPPPPVV